MPLVGAALWAAQRAYETSQNEYLFPRYCSDDGCKADYASNALNKWMRPKVQRGSVIHGFRHSFRDRLREKECPPDVIDELGGWRTAGVGQNYGFGYSLDVKQKWMMKISLQQSNAPICGDT